MPGLSHPLKRRRPKHPHPETSLGRVREVAVVAREPVRNELRATWLVIISDVENNGLEVRVRVQNPFVGDISRPTAGVIL
jgi:hypothetical protein